MNENAPENVSAPMPSNERRPTTPLPSEAVLRGQSAVEIEHNGQVYRLQTTRQGKLILTK
jgi:hemin uptake protein HemP